MCDLKQVATYCSAPDDWDANSEQVGADAVDVAVVVVVVVAAVVVVDVVAAAAAAE